MNPLPDNTFFDINTLPVDEGILFFGISMNRIGNTQSTEKCFEYVQYLDTKITKTNGIGGVFLYSDYLYFLSQEPARILRDRYKDLMTSHKDGLLRLIAKDQRFVAKAFSFRTLGQLFVDNSDIYKKSFDIVKKMYADDFVFQKYVREDAKNNNHETEEEEEVLFILEEITLFYLIQKGQIDLYNHFVTDTEKKWILQCCPGKPLKSEVYLFQKNPLTILNTKNKYENSYYDLESKILYDYSRLDIETFNFT